MIEIHYASEKDFEILKEYDRHISSLQLKRSIAHKRVLVIFNHELKLIGWLRFNLFWDSIPFMNMLYLIEEYRGKGYGKQLLDFWEKEMKNQNYSMVMTSTQSDERGQFFYRRNGYADCGALLFPHEPLEIILFKNLS